MTSNDLSNWKNNLKKTFAICFSFLTIYQMSVLSSYAFPIFAQQGYENPREATGRIVCANCHLAQKEVSIETPQSVLPNSIFEAIVKIPYESNTQQVLGNGAKGSLNVGAILVLPEGFKLAPKNMLSEELKEKTKNIYIQTYSTTKENILVVGPISGEKNREIIFPVLSPDPNTNKNVHFLKYPVYVGGNRGRGQIYPAGNKSNNNAITASYGGKIINILKNEKKGFDIEIEKRDGEIYQEKIPEGLEIQVQKGSTVLANQNLTNDPNVGGFGQDETEIVLQNPLRIKGMIAFFFSVILAQIFFVLKKKQWEKVQAAEMNF